MKRLIGIWYTFYHRPNGNPPQERDTVSFVSFPLSTGNSNYFYESRFILDFYRRDTILAHRGFPGFLSRSPPSRPVSLRFPVLVWKSQTTKYPNFWSRHKTINLNDYRPVNSTKKVEKQTKFISLSRSLLPFSTFTEGVNPHGRTKRKTDPYDYTSGVSVWVCRLLYRVPSGAKHINISYTHILTQVHSFMYPLVPTFLLKTTFLNLYDKEHVNTEVSKEIVCE